MTWKKNTHPQVFPIEPPELPEPCSDRLHGRGDAKQGKTSELSVSMDPIYLNLMTSNWQWGHPRKMAGLIEVLGRSWQRLSVSTVYRWLHCPMQEPINNGHSVDQHMILI